MRFSPSKVRTPELELFESLKFGMFIHFGLATFSQDEYADRQADIELYKPTSLDPDQWVHTAKEAGMKYAVLTARHQQGHCLWPSKFTEFSVANSPVQRDVVGEFVAACHKHGVLPGLYYLLGWELKHQSQLDPPRYSEFLINQLAELLSNYGPIFELWLDIPFDLGPNTQEILQKLYEHIKSIQPGCLVMLNCSEWEGESIRRRKATYNFKDIDGPEISIWPADLIDGERTPPPVAGHDPKIELEGATYYLPMEVCDSIGKYWFHIDGDAPKNTDELVALYQATVGRGANLLLNVPPDRTGRIPQECIDALADLAKSIS